MVIPLPLRTELRRVMERRKAAHPKQWSWRDPMINSRWACVRKICTDEGLEPRFDVLKPVSNLFAANIGKIWVFQQHLLNFLSRVGDQSLSS